MDHTNNVNDVITKIRALSWNIRSVNSNKQQLYARMTKTQYDVVMLQETGITHQKRFEFKLPGYKIFYSFCNGEKRKRGLITAVRDTHPVEKLPSKYDLQEENLIVNIKTPDGIIEFQNLYYNHGLNIKPKIIKHNDKARYLVRAGDANAHHTSWGCKHNNKRGIDLLHVVNESDVVLVNDGTPTTTNNTTIDLCLVSSNIAHKTTVEVLDLLSDVHYGLDISIGVGKYLSKDEFVPRLKFEEADWERFKLELDQNLSKANIVDEISADNLDDTAQRVAEIYYDTATRVIPKTKFHDRPWRAWYWNSACERANNNVNYWTRVNKKRNLIIPNSKQNLKDAKAEAEEVYDNAKRAAWAKICESITLNNNDSQTWKRIKFIRQGGTAPNNSKHLEPLNKANELAKHFAQRTHTANLNQSIKDTLNLLRPEMLQRINEAINTPDPDTDQDKNTAPGDDKVTYNMLKHSGPTARTIAQKLYNISWNASKLAKGWKIANQVAIPKPGQRDAFRPISLLSVFDKNLERIAKDRMLAKVEHKLSKNVLGFRRERGTSDGLIALSQKASEVIHRHRNYKNGKKCVAVFIDLEKAFELANKDVILYELTKLGVRGKLLGWLQDYLSDRKGYVTIDGYKSDITDFENGTPQGSILSPFLFNILVNALVSKEYPAGVSVYSYADDIILVINEKKM